MKEGKGIGRNESKREVGLVTCTDKKNLRRRKRDDSSQIPHSPRLTHLSNLTYFPPARSILLSVTIWRDIGVSKQLFTVLYYFNYTVLPLFCPKTDPDLHIVLKDSCFCLGFLTFTIGIVNNELKLKRLRSLGLGTHLQKCGLKVVGSKICGFLFCGLGGSTRHSDLE